MYVISDQGELVTRYDERLLLSTKLSFMYTPGSGPVTFKAGGLRLGARWASRSLPGVFAEYEHLDVAGVLICAGPGQTPGGTAPSLPGAGPRRSNSPPGYRWTG